MSAGPLNYESASHHPGRFRVQESLDFLEVSLVRRPAWDKVPWIVLIWVGAAALCIALWWLAGHITFGGPTEGRLVLVILSVPFSALIFSGLLIMQDRQQLAIRVDAGGVTITRTMMGTPDRQRLALRDLVAIGFDPGSKSVISFVTPKGATNVMIARKPVYVQEIVQLIVGRVDLLREGYEKH